MGGTLILPTINAGKEGECARGMAELVVFSTGGAGGCLALGFRVEPAAGGAELVQPGLLIASLPVPGAVREGVWWSFPRGQRTLYMQN